jgi:nucleoid associated protein NdpA
LDLGTFSVARLIVHEVPRRSPAGSDAGGPILADEESPLTNEIKTFFQERITTTLRSERALEVLTDDASESVVPKLVNEHLDPNQPDRFVEASQEMAEALFKSQNRVNPTGLLTVISGEIDGKPAIAILKLEKEEGARAHLVGAKGHRRFEIEHLSELMLTEAVRVFKASIFRVSLSDDEVVEGIVSDQQLGRQTLKDIADFFLVRFLGCRLKDEPKVRTKSVYRETEAFINSAVDDPADRTKYEMALMTELNSQVATFSPKTFAEHNLKPKDRDNYLRRMKEAGLASSFKKDIDLIVKQIDQVAMEFENNLRLTGTPQALEDSVTVEDAGDGNARVTIEEKLRRVRGR